MTWRIRSRWTGLAGAPYMSTWYFEQTVTPDPADAADIVAGQISLFTDFFASSLTHQVDSEVVRFTTPDTPAEVVTIPTVVAQVGSATGPELPRAAQGLLRLRTGAYIGAREVQGRIFLPGPCTDDLGADGTPNNPYVAALGILGAGLIAGGLQVASRKSNLFYGVTSASGWNEYAVLRSRRD